MDRRFTIFAILVALIFVANQIVYTRFIAPKKPEAQGKQVAKAAPGKDGQPKDGDAKAGQPDAKDGEAKPDEKADPGDIKAAEPEKEGEPAKEAEGTLPEAADQKPADKPDAEDKDKPAEPAAVAPLRGTLGSGDENSDYRMLVTWNNAGGSIECLELNSPRFLNLDDRSGYLGYLAPVDAEGGRGARVRVVGAGTPAAAAGLERDDVITGIAGTKIASAVELLAVLETTEPGQTIKLLVDRGGAAKELSATLRRRPLDVIHPEYETKQVGIVKPGKHDPLSFLTTIQQFDDRTLASDNQDGSQELGGVKLRDAAWEVVKSDTESVQFKSVLPKLGLEITKTYRLAKVPADERANTTYPAYNLVMELSIQNVGSDSHTVAYRLDGPTGLPTEGAWYASKVGRGGMFASAPGLRDVIVRFNGGTPEQVAPAQLVKPDFKQDWGGVAPLDFIAVDAQYFSVALIPQEKQPADIWFQSIVPLAAGQLPKENPDTRLLDVSFRIDSKPAELKPGGALEHQFQIFAGPKRPRLLDHYGPPSGNLGSLVYYGWFGPIAQLLSGVLHAFYVVVGNYGIAIIMLTVLVRGCMFPVSRRQAMGAQKMQELQPEMKRINEKYKNDAEKRTRATQDLFRQHKYNPLGGCLLAFAQLPIFVGLYRSLMVNVELRQAPLISESIRWASNLAAPDMLWNWTGVMPQFVTQGTGILGLGPYLNVLPLVTIALFIWQQKMFMPPAADEQAAMQQKMMQYMMIFMGVLFFKVASGLCLYFIASSLWGVAERKLLPKKAGPNAPGGGTGDPVPATSQPSSGNGAPAGKKKQRDRK